MVDGNGKMGKRYPKHYYTLEQVSELSGIPANTVRQHILRQKLDPGDFASIFFYISNKRSEAGLGT